MLSKSKVEEFLRESNAIEGVFDDQSLADALDAWEYLMSVRTLTKAVVLETHRRLMMNQPLEEKYKGVFRDIDVYIGGKIAVTPSVVELMIGDFCARTMARSPDAQNLHVYYEKVHPFVDGNGRSGRLLLNWTRIKRGRQPLLVIKDAEKQAYYQWFK